MAKPRDFSGEATALDLYVKCLGFLIIHGEKQTHVCRLDLSCQSLVCHLRVRTLLVLASPSCPILALSCPSQGGLLETSQRNTGISAPRSPRGPIPPLSEALPLCFKRRGRGTHVHSELRLNSIQTNFCYLLDLFFPLRMKVNRGHNSAPVPS